MQNSKNTSIFGFKFSFFCLALFAIFAGFAFADVASIALNYPANNTFVNTSTPQLNFTALTDDLNDTLLCNLTINGLINRTGLSVTNNTLTSTTAVDALIDGEYLWSIDCEENGSVLSSGNNTLIVDTQKPSFALANFSNQNNILGNFSFVVTDAAPSTIMNCSLYIDGNLTFRNLSVIHNTYTNFTNLTTELAEGTHNMTFTCFDTGNGTADMNVNSTTVSFNITRKPTFTAITYTALNSTFGEVSFTARAGVNAIASTTNCSLYFDGNTSARISWNASVVNNSAATFTNSTASLSEGAHTANITCYDSADVVSNATGVAFTADRTAPTSVTLSYPANSSYVANNSQFKFTAIDAVSSTLNCTLFVENGTFSTNITVVNNTVTTFSSINLQGNFTTNQALNWNVTCRDAGLNLLSSSNRTVRTDFGAPVNGTLSGPTAIDYNYSTTATYAFSAVFNDSLSGVNKVWVLINQTTNMNSTAVIRTIFANYTLTINGSTNYSNATLGPLPAGNYTYTFYVNDSVGNINSTAAAFFTVAKATPVCNYTGSNVTFPTNASVTFACTNGDSDATFVITRNSTSENGTLYNATINNSVSKLLAPGWYEYYANMTDTENYTNGSSIVNISVFVGVLTLNITSSTNFSIFYTDAVTITGTGCPTGEGNASVHCLLNISNSTFSGLPVTVVSPKLINMTYAPGVYNLTFNTTATTNYTAASYTTLLTISRAQLPMNLLLDGLYGNKTFNNASVMNVSAFPGNVPNDASFVEGSYFLHLIENGTILAGANATYITNKTNMTAGVHTYVLMFNGTQNFTARNVSLIATVGNFAVDTNQTVANNATVNLNNVTSQVIVPADSPVRQVLVDSTIMPTTPVYLNLSLLVATGGSISSAVFNTSLNLTRNTTGYNYQVNIPAGANISGASTWNNNFAMPLELANSTVTVTPDAGKTLNGIVQVVEVGAGDTPLTSSKAVRLLFTGLSNNWVGWYQGSAFNTISSTCTADTQEAGDALAAGADCAMSSGNDKVIWTKHFSKFVVYQQTTTPTPGGSGGSGGSSSGSSAPYVAPSTNTTTITPTTPTTPTEPTTPTTPTEPAKKLAVITVPSSVTAGETIVLVLADQYGAPISGAVIVVKDPSGNDLEYTTDANGYARFVALVGGSHTYLVRGYELTSGAATVVIAKVSQVQPTAAEQAAQAAQEAAQAAPAPLLGGALFLVGAGAIVLIVLVAVAYLLFFKKKGGKKGL